VQPLTVFLLHDLPYRFLQAIQMMYNGTLQPFQFTEKVKAQYSTNYLRWTRGAATHARIIVRRADMLWLTTQTRR